MNDGVMHAPVLVTGANSQVGRCALDRLAESNVSVVACVRHMHPENILLADLLTVAQRRKHEYLQKSLSLTEPFGKQRKY